MHSMSEQWMDWKPIETAPADGQQILVGFCGQFKWFSYVANAMGRLDRKIYAVCATDALDSDHPTSRSAPMTTHWTSHNGWTNASPEFQRMCDEVERIIRSDAHSLINGHAQMTARLIMAQLAHVHGLAPKEDIK